MPLLEPLPLYKGHFTRFTETNLLELMPDAQFTVFAKGTTNKQKVHAWILAEIDVKWSLMLRTIFLDMTAIFHKLPAIGAHLKYNDIDIKLVSLLSAAQNIISFLLMIIPLKILLFIISDDINFALFSAHIDKYVYLSLLIVVFAFFAITFEAIKARIKSVKYQLSLKYRNIDRKRDFYRDNLYVVPIIDHMINFHA